MIDPRHPNYADTPARPNRPRFEYRPDSRDVAPLVSIITPYFNTGAVFAETVACVLGQSWQRWEWLIVDNGTTDAEARAVLAAQLGQDARIRLIELGENRGPGAARNHAATIARGRYLFFLDADDLIEPTTLEKCVWFLETRSELACVKGYTVGFGSEQYLWRRGFHEPQEFLRENCATVTALLRRECFLAVGGFDESIQRGMEDWDLWLRLAANGHWGGTIPEFLDWYRRRPDEQRPWTDLDRGQRQQQFRDALALRYPAVFQNGIVVPEPRPVAPYEPCLLPADLANPLQRRPQRVLMIVPWLTMGGADKFNRDLVDQIVARGWEVSIATTLPGEQPWLPDFTRRTPDVFVLPHFLRPHEFGAFLCNLIQSRQPEVVLLSNSELGYLLLPLLRARCPAPAYIDYCHMEEDYWKNGGYPRYAAGRQPELDLNIVSSQHLKAWMVAHGGDSRRIEVCYTNRDAEEWRRDPQARQQRRTMYEIPEDVPLILYAGRLCRQKKPTVFAETMRRLAAQPLSFRALVAGYGEDEPWLRAFLDEHRLNGHVTMLGAVPSDDMTALMSAADIFFLPSLWEGIALTLFEAMSMELAIVATDVGGQRELVTPECGYLIPPGPDELETAEYARVLAELLRNPPLVRRLGKAGRQRILQHFPLEQMGDRMAALFALARDWRARAPRITLPAALAEEYARLGHAYVQSGRDADELWKRVHSIRAEAESHWRSKLEAVTHERDQYQAEAQRLSAAWQQHTSHIRELEQLNRDLWDQLQEVVRERDRMRRSLYWRLRRLASNMLSGSGK